MRGITVAVWAAADKLALARDPKYHLKPYPLDVTDASAVAATFSAIERNCARG